MCAYVCAFEVCTIIGFHISLCVSVWIYAFEIGACSHQNKELDLLELQIQVVVSISLTEVPETMLETMSSSRAMSPPRGSVVSSTSLPRLLQLLTVHAGTCPIQ